MQIAPVAIYHLLKLGKEASEFYKKFNHTTFEKKKYYSHIYLTYKSLVNSNSISALDFLQNLAIYLNLPAIVKRFVLFNEILVNVYHSRNFF